MPLYMDIHELPEGTTPEDVAKAHAKDMETQRKYGVEYTKYWFNEKARKVFCLVHAPNAEAAQCVHREAHGLMAEKLIEIQPELLEGFLGGVETNSAGAAVLPDAGTDPRDPGIRTVLFTDVVNSTTLTQALGDEAALAILGVHDVIVRDALSALGGREVKHTGDGIVPPRGYLTQLRALCDAQFKSNVNWTNMRKQIPIASLRFEWAPQPVNLSSNITISLEQRFNWRPACARTRSQNKSWYRTRSPSYASAKDSCLKTSAKLL